MKGTILSYMVIGLLAFTLAGLSSMAASPNGVGSEPFAPTDPLVISDANHKASTPTMVVAPDGRINLIWVERQAVQAKPPKGHGHSHRIYTNLYFVRSTDNGRTFSRPVQVNSVIGSVWGFSTSKPRIALDQSGTIHVFYAGNRSTATAASDAVDARYTRSTDGGRSFEPARTLNSVNDKDQSEIVGGGLTSAHCFGSMDVSADGKVYAAWIDTRHMQEAGANGSIYAARSLDGGKTFEPERLISQNTACPCCQVQVAFSSQRTVFVSSRHVYQSGARNSVVMRSQDAGKTFAQPIRLTEKNWMIDGCPLKPASITPDKDGRLFSAWYTEAENPAGVYFTVSRDGGITFSKPLAMHPEAKNSDHPQIAVSPNGTVYLVWDAKVGEGRGVFLRVSNDHGETFGPVRSFGASSGSARFPTVAVGKNDAIHLAWQQDNRVLFQTLDAEAVRRH